MASFKNALWLLLPLVLILNFTRVAMSFDINVFLYDSSQETTDKSSEILSNCNCTSRDIATSFNQSWNIIYNKSQETVENITNINFYFLSNLIITNQDINNYINDIPASNINFQCAKSLEIFNSISWHIDDAECLLTFNDKSIQNDTDSLLLSYIDNTTVQTLNNNTIITVNDLIINFNPNNDDSNVASNGILLQTVGNYNDIKYFDFVLNNIIIEGFNINSPLFFISHHVVSLSITNCEFYDMSHGIFTSNYIANININNIKIANVTDFYQEPITISETDNLTMANIESDDCHGERGCISIEDSHTFYLSHFKCNKCSGRVAAAAFYADDINTMIASNIYISNCMVTGDDDSMSDRSDSAIFSVDDIFNYMEITNGIFRDNSASDGSVLVLSEVHNFSLNNLSFISNQIRAITLSDNIYGVINDCNFTDNVEKSSGGAFSMLPGHRGDEYYINNCIFEGNIADKFGGAILVQYCNVLITNSLFIRNEADIGGAIAYLDWASTDPLRITNCSFMRNIAYSSGAAMYVFSGEYILDNIQCIGNQAKISGGCLHDANGFLDCNDANPVRTRIISSTFYGNKARQAAVGYLTSCYFSMNDSQIINNTAYIQGGGFVIDSTAIDEDGNQSQYELNNIIFEGNYGGLSGGALILTGGNILISGNTQFSHNTAGSKGGAILIQGIDEWNVNTQIENAQFIGNNAENGGAVLMETIQLSPQTNDIDTKAANLILTECDLHANQGVLGGALYIGNGNVLSSDCLLSDNTANNGGALYFENGKVTDYNSIYFENYAHFKGGAVYTEHSNILFDATELTENSANYGGAVYFNDAQISGDTQECVLTQKMSNNVTIKNNTAGLSGGGYFFEVNDILRATYENSNCSVTSSACQWCRNCDIFSNFASGFGNDLGTKAYKMNVLWNIKVGEVLNRVTSIRVDVDIRDFVCDLVSLFDESDVTLTANISTHNNDEYALILDGASLETFANGRASLLFQVIAENEHAAFIKHDIVFNATLSVSSSFMNENDNIKLFRESINVYYENKLYQLPTYVVVLGVLLGILSLITVFVTIYFTHYYGTKKEKIITGSNVYFLFIILTGIAFASLSMIFVTLVPFNMDCRVLLWFVHFAFVLTVCPLAGKTWRIWLFFYYYQGSDQKKKEFKWTTLRLANVFVVLPLCVVIIYLLIWSFAADWNFEYSYSAEGDFVIKSCRFHAGFYTLSYVVVTISILILVRLAIGTRKVPRNFNESFWLGACIYTICILIIFMIPISLVNTINTATRRTFTIIASFVVIESMLLFLFWTKFFRIKGWFKSTKFAFIRNTAAVSSHATHSNDKSNIIHNTTKGKVGGEQTGNTISSAKNKILNDMRNRNKNKNKNKLSATDNTDHEKNIIPSTTNTQLTD